MQQQKQLVDSILIPHAAFMRGLNRLEQALKFAKGSSEPLGLSISGPSRAGKSRLIEQFTFARPPKRKVEGLQVPILVVKVPAVPTIKGLASMMLLKLGDPLSDARETENQKTYRLVKLIRECQVEAIVLDESQHFADKGSDKILYAVSNWLKLLMDETKVLTVVAGLPTINHILDQNEQLAGRFTASIELNRFDWKSSSSRNEFIAILKAFEDGLKPFSFPELDSQDMAFRFYVATGGLIGYIIKILRQAQWDAISEDRHVITLENLAVAWTKAVRTMGQLDCNPFSRTFMEINHDQQLGIANLIGAPIPAPATKRRG